jgi:hypothetical protein
MVLTESSNICKQWGQATARKSVGTCAQAMVRGLIPDAPKS